ncbi:MAG: SAF domain-containing protein [Anaerovoracaceae bacterium]
MKNKRTILGIMLIVIAIIGTFGWETWGRKHLTYDEALVLNTDVEKSQTITASMLTSKRIPDSFKDSYKSNEINQVIGMEAKQYIHKGSELFPQYFDSNGLVVSDSEFILSMPNEWIKAFPQTLRRGDTAYIYAISDAGAASPKYITSAKVAFSKDNTNNEVKSKDRNRLSGSGSVALIEIIVNQKQADLITSSISDDIQFVIMYR